MIADLLKGFLGSLFVVGILFGIAVIGGWFNDTPDKGIELGSMLITAVCFLAIVSVCRGDPR